MYRVCAADGRRTSFRQTDVADFPFADQFGQCADSLLDCDLRVHAMLVVEVYVVGTESPKRALDCSADVRGATIEYTRATTRVRDQSELRRQDDLVSAALDGPPDELFVDEGAVDLGGVEMGNPKVECQL